MASNPVYSRPVGIFDLETTGLDPERHEILEFGAVILTSDFKFKRAINYRLIPEHLDQAEPKALEVNGYTPERWQHAISQTEGITKLLNFLSVCGVVFAFNSTFDYGFLEFSVRRLGIKFLLPRYRLDMMTLAWMHQRDAQRYFTLKDTCSVAGVRAERTVHVAVNGALASARFLRYLYAPKIETVFMPGLRATVDAGAF